MDKTSKSELRSYKITVTIVALLITITSSAQDWKLDWGTWTYEYSLFGSTKGLTTNRIVDTTTIQGKLCRVLEREVNSCVFRPSIEYLYKENDSLYYFESSEDQFRLLYDFSAEKGDIIRIMDWPYFEYPNDTIYIRIDSLDNIDVDGIELKRFFVNYGFFRNNEIVFGDSEFFTRVIIEDIGSLTNLFHFPEDGSCDGTHVNELRCYEDSVISINFNEDLECNQVIVSSEQIDRQPEIQIYPNPTNESIFIETTLALDSQISILDLHGRVIYDSELGGKCIDLTNITAGIYYLVISDNARSYRQTIIKN